MSPTAPPNLPKTDEAELSCQSSQMVPLMRENISKSKVTAVKANLPTCNLSVAIQHLGSNAYGPKINKNHQMKTFTCPFLLLLPPPFPVSSYLLRGKWGSGLSHKNELPFILYHANPKYFWVSKNVLEHFRISSISWSIWYRNKTSKNGKISKFKTLSVSLLF